MDLMEAAFPGRAESGGAALDTYLDGMHASHRGTPAIDTVIGHSYGWTLVGGAATGDNQLAADNVIAVGSPGMLVDAAGDLNLDSGSKVFSVTARNDIISLATDTTLGADPFTEAFGGTRLWANPGPSWDPTGLIGDVAAHSSYWDPGNPALANMGAIIAGRPPLQIVTPDGVVTGPMTVLTRLSASRFATLAVLLMLCLPVAGCGNDGDLGSPTPSGATDIGGPPMTSQPPPPPGWNPKEVVPQSQQEAQDKIAGYLQRMLDALPAGTVYDTGRYSGRGHNSSCDDNYTGPGKPPTHFTTTGDLTFPPGSDLPAMIAKTGEIWRSWGWHVYERDGFEKPNQFGYAPDGYRLQIVAAYPPDYPPTVVATSPCFPGDIARDDIAFPAVLRAGRHPDAIPTRVGAFWRRSC